MIRLIHARLRRIAEPSSKERGISLVELLVAMMVFALLLAMTVGFFASANRANLLDRTLDTSNRSASSALDEVTRMIRGAVTHPVNGQQVDDAAFTTAGANSIVFYTSINLTGSTATMLKVAFTITTAGALQEQIWQPSVVSGFSTYVATPTTTRIIATPIVLQAAGGPAAFSYLDSTGLALPMTSGAVLPTNIGSIAAVTVSIQVGASNSSSQSTLLTNTVGLPNLNIARNPS